MGDVKGLPAGAVVKPIAGLPPGAVVRPVAQSSPTRAFAPASTFPSIPWFKEAGYNLIDRGSNMLPAVGGAVGGLIGGAAGSALPLAGTVAAGTGGAALGGAAGESARELIRRGMGYEGLPQTSLDAAKAIGTEGAKQGAYEAGGQVVGLIGRAVAPTMARSALKIPGQVEKHGAQTGRGILDETTAIRPGVVSEQAKNRIASLSAEHDAATAGVPVTLQPAISNIDSSITGAMERNSPNELQQLNSIKKQLTVQHGPTGEPLRVPVMRPGAGFVPGAPVQVGTITQAIPTTVMGPRIRAIRQGIDSEVTGWNSPVSSYVDAATQRLHGAINEPLHAAVPAAKALDQRMSNLIPVAQYAEKAANRAGIVENLLTPKGSSLTNAGAALGLGARATPQGALLGAVAGRVIPEVTMRPSFRLGVARIANSPLLPGVITNVPRFGVGLMMPTNEELLQKRKEEEGEQ